MNGHPAGLAYVRFGDGPYVAVGMTVMALAPDGRISGMDTFILPCALKLRSGARPAKSRKLFTGEFAPAAPSVSAKELVRP